MKQKTKREKKHSSGNVRKANFTAKMNMLTAWLN